MRFLLIAFVCCGLLSGMAVDNALERAAKWAALKKSLDDLDAEADVLSKVPKVRQRNRSDAVGSHLEFLNKSLDQCSVVDYSGSSDGEVTFVRSTASSYSTRRSSSTSD